MRILLQICLVLTTYLAASSRAQSSAQSCQAGSINIPTDEDAVEVGSNTVFLNREDPAECDGQVYGWHICRARRSNVPNPEVILAMYHRVSSVFTVVDGSYRELIEPSEYFRVKRGDVVGVCYEEDSENTLELVVENTERELEILSTESCLINIAQVSNQSPRREVALLLSVYIDINECLLGEAMCHENAACSDVVGGENSYNCTCNPGFTGDGFSCVGNSEGAAEVSTATEVGDGGGSEGTTEVGTSSNDRPTSNNEVNVSITPPDNSKRRGQENDSVVGAIVAAFVVVFLIIAVVVTSIILYLSRQRIEQALGRTIDLRRVTTSKRTDTLAKVPDEDHDYDYVIATGQPVDNEYETVNKTPLPAQTSSVVPTSDYEVPVQSLPCKFDPPLKNSPQYEAMLSAPSVKLEVGKVCLHTSS
ncbi:hypothetical protein GBAR_LOCUS13193 [Geodia barretti]|uniref:EGF-like domain-containing protein n=1 Tax=Geodia barretti TaxID=519541 RepID=A0AA35S4G2_GEOBA|nr:hypothetical protein GBAR_LOCUS13193 [Geodia barretti]